MKKLFSIKEAIIFIIENSRLRSEFNQENYTISEYHNTLLREIEENTNTGKLPYIMDWKVTSMTIPAVHKGTFRYSMIWIKM